MNTRILSTLVATILLGSTGFAFADEQHSAVPAQHHVKKHSAHHRHHHAKFAGHHHVKAHTTHDINKG
ncbi:MAG: hypothetical protein V4443_04435 [Pseudomonadota bacterium]